MLYVSTGDRYYELSSPAPKELDEYFVDLLRRKFVRKCFDRRTLIHMQQAVLNEWERMIRTGAVWYDYIDCCWKVEWNVIRSLNVSF